MAAFFALHQGLPRQGPGSDDTTRRMLALAQPMPPKPRVLDIGCGPGRSAMLLAAEAQAVVTAVDTHQPFLAELAANAQRRGLTEQITPVQASMADLPFPDGGFDLIWAEGSAYIIGFETALRTWRRLLAAGGVLVVTECGWATDTPSPSTRRFWEAANPMRDVTANTVAAEGAGFQVVATHTLPERDWFDEYYQPLARRLATADTTVPGMAKAVATQHAQIELRREYGDEYQYTGYILRRAADSAVTNSERNIISMMDGTWNTRVETPQDRPDVRRVLLSAFDTAAEADLVDALRGDEAWIPELSILAEAADGSIVAHALLTRCHVGDQSALALAPCAVAAEFQRRGAGAAAIKAALAAARERGENLVLVLGHPQYYPRFGFTPASRFGIRAPFDVPDEAMMAMALDDTRPIAAGTIRYAAPFGI